MQVHKSDVNLLNYSPLFIFCKYLTMFAYVLFSIFYVYLSEGWTTCYSYNLKDPVRNSDWHHRHTHWKNFSISLLSFTMFNKGRLFQMVPEAFWKKETCFHAFHIVYLQQSLRRQLSVGSGKTLCKKRTVGASGSTSSFEKIM